MQKTSSKLTDIEYLYGVSFPLWKNLPYQEALHMKASLADQVIRFQNLRHWSIRDYYRVIKCVRAINHNRMLLNECQILKENK
jgi:hypothetical protein